MSIAHLAAACELLGDKEAADKYLAMCSWPENDAHVKGNIELDKFIINHNREDFISASENFVNASRWIVDFKSYVGFSQLIKSFIKSGNYPELDNKWYRAN